MESFHSHSHTFNPDYLLLWMLRMSLPHLRFWIIFMWASGNFSFSSETLVTSISVILSHWTARWPTDGWTTRNPPAACRNVTWEYSLCSGLFSQMLLWSHISYWVTVVSPTWDILHGKWVYTKAVLPHPVPHPLPLPLPLPGNHRAWLQALAVNCFHPQKV